MFLLSSVGKVNHRLNEMFVYEQTCSENLYLMIHFVDLMWLNLVVGWVDLIGYLNGTDLEIYFFEELRFFEESFVELNYEIHEVQNLLIRNPEVLRSGDQIFFEQDSVYQCFDKSTSETEVRS